MSRIGAIQNENGAVPAYGNKDWVCSTGLFQFALIWYRLGDREHGDKAFRYACKLQNHSGGWYGSYLSENNPNENNTYFPDAEISWAVKYFLDALYYKNVCQFDFESDKFQDSIEKKDGRYRIVLNAVKSFKKRGINILDVGCGKGRYILNLVEDCPNSNYYAIDISDKVMRYITNELIVKRQGNLTNIPFDNNSMDLIYTCEALEHAIDIDSAIKELFRVVKPGGKVIVIDKNQNMLGCMNIGEWEQWFDISSLKKMMMRYCTSVDVFEDVSYENRSFKGLFSAWIGTKKQAICKVFEVEYGKSFNYFTNI